MYRQAGPCLPMLAWWWLVPTLVTGAMAGASGAFVVHQRSDPASEVAPQSVKNRAPEANSLILKRPTCVVDSHPT